MDAGAVVREARRRRGVSQQGLARRAGTSQAAISRIEAGLESPTLDRLERLLLVLGEQLVCQTTPLEHDLDESDLDAGRRLTPAERLAESASWNLVATQLEIAGARARSEP